jgi:hypothetical protein
MLRLKKVGTGHYQIMIVMDHVETGTDYFIERMEDGTWQAYQPSAWEYHPHLWLSPKHRTRQLAYNAANFERRRIMVEARNAIRGENK